MDIKKEMITVNEPVLKTNEKVLVSGDIIVPDVKSDLARILKIDADAVVEGASTLSGKLEVYGKIYITILYVPENDPKPVCSISTEMPFDTVIENDKITDDVKYACTADVFNVEFNMLNSRKLSVKTVVDLAMRGVRKTEQEFVVSLDSENFEANREEESVYSLVCLKNNKFTSEEVLDFPTGKPSAVSLLKTDVKLLNYQTHIVTGKIVVKGLVESCSLYVSDEGKIEFVSHEIPFTEVIDADGVNEKCYCDLCLSLLPASASLKADSDGDMRLIELEMLFEAEIVCYEQTDIRLISDCYSCTEGFDAVQKSVTLEKLIHKEDVRHNLKGAMSIGESMPPVDTVYNLMVKPYVENITTGNGDAVIEGVCDCYVLYLSEKETTPVCSAMGTIPFSFSVTNKDITPASKANACVQLASCSYNLSISGEIEIRAAFDAAVTITEQHTKEFVSDIKESEEAYEKRHGIIVYFVKKGDSLWKIAKRYRVCLKELTELNKLENPDLIFPGQPILIPMP